jgi:cell shape-determining protein MreC
MKNWPKNFEDQEKLVDEYNRLLNKYNLLKDKNRRLKELLGFRDTEPQLWIRRLSGMEA